MENLNQCNICNCALMIKNNNNYTIKCDCGSRTQTCESLIEVEKEWQNIRIKNYRKLEFGEYIKYHNNKFTLLNSSVLYQNKPALQIVFDKQFNDYLEDKQIVYGYLSAKVIQLFPYPIYDNGTENGGKIDDDTIGIRITKDNKNEYGIVWDNKHQRYLFIQSYFSNEIFKTSQGNKIRGFEDQLYVQM